MMPTPEREVSLTTDMKELGCPYLPTDPRARAWLLGLKAGVKMGQEMASAVFEEAISGLL